MFKTRDGAARRLDLIFVPPEELALGTLGWIGSRQFLRFMRAYSDSQMGMHLNAHRCTAKPSCCDTALRSAACSRSGTRTCMRLQASRVRAADLFALQPPAQQRHDSSTAGVPPSVASFQHMATSHTFTSLRC